MSSDSFGFLCVLVLTETLSASILHLGQYQNSVSKDGLRLPFFFCKNSKEDKVFYLHLAAVKLFHFEFALLFETSYCCGTMTF